MKDVTLEIACINDKTVTKAELVKLVEKAEQQSHKNLINSLGKLNVEKVGKERILEWLFDFAKKDYRGLSEDRNYFLDIGEMVELGITDTIRKKFFPRNDYWRNTGGRNFCQLFLVPRIEWYLENSEELRDAISKSKARREKLAATRERNQSENERKEAELQSMLDSLPEFDLEMYLGQNELVDAVFTSLTGKESLKEIQKELVDFVLECGSNFDEVKEMLYASVESKWKRSVLAFLKRQAIALIEERYPNAKYFIQSKWKKEKEVGALVRCKVGGKDICGKVATIIALNSTGSFRVKFLDSEIVQNFKSKNLKLVS